jgi:transglutaminase-like putative cysteine protease
LLWRIRHTTAYRYSAPVFLEPHVLRLTPASDATQRLLRSELLVTPAPIARSDNVDTDGNNTTQVWFEGEAQSLTIEATSQVETLRPNAFEYFWEGARRVPVRYGERLAQTLRPYMASRSTGAVGALADAAAIAAEGDAQAFPLALVASIHKTCRQIRREEGEPLPAAATLRAGEGSCRDLAQVFLEASRSKGYAGRFVSGYIATRGEQEAELHAWAELYMPGGGWRGFDSTTGLAVADRHIALARSATPSLAATVSGCCRGAATASLSATLSIEREGRA